MTKTKTIRLEDLAPRKESVKISGNRALEVAPLGVGDIASLFIAFPDLAQAMSGKMDAKALAKTVPSAIPSIIATGAGMPGDSGEKLARSLNPADQLMILTGIINTTFPEGMGPFLEALEALAGQAESLAPETLAEKLLAETSD